MIALARRQYQKKRGDKPHEIKVIGEVTGHLRRVLRKNKRAVPPAKREMLCGILSYWWHYRLRGQAVIHPGKQKIASWGDCDPSYVKRFLRELEGAGIAIIADNMLGGRGLAAEYQIDVKNLCRWLIELGANLSPRLLEKIRDVEDMCSKGTAAPEKRGGS